MRPLRLACLAYLSVALPGSTLGLLWPSIRLSFHQPVGALGILLAFGAAASVLASAATGPLLARSSVGVLTALGTVLVAAALALEAVAPSLLVFVCGSVVFSLGFGALDSALNAHAASHFGARDINWMHACYGLGATIGPLVVTAVLGLGLTWRSAYAIMAATQCMLATVFVLARRWWQASDRHALPSQPGQDSPPHERLGKPGHPKPRALGVAAALAFSALETGIESGAGIWGYLFLSGGRGLPHDLAGVAVSAYWAMMSLGRAVLGPVAQRVGASRVLAAAVVSVALGAAMMTVPGPSIIAVTGMMVIGVAAAPVFPLFTLTTAKRAGLTEATTTRVVSLQVAASTIGAAGLPAGIGVAIGASNAKVLAPLLLSLSLVMCGLYGLVARDTRHPGARG